MPLPTVRSKPIKKIACISAALQLEKASAEPIALTVLKLKIQNIMTQITDTDLQQLKDLITDLNKNVEVGFTRTDERLKSVEKQLTDIRAQFTDLKTDQRSQDNRFFALIFFILTTAIIITAKLAKLY